MTRYGEVATGHIGGADATRALGAILACLAATAEMGGWQAEADATYYELGSTNTKESA